MHRKHLLAGGRSAVLAAALFAITINFLQPLVHAALLRGGPTTVAIWKSMCLSASQEDDTRPQKDEPHACCLGMANAPSLPALAGSFVAVQLVARVESRPAVAVDALAPVGIRDGPPQPHGPPSPS